MGFSRFCVHLSRGTLFEEIIKRAALAGLLALTTSALVAQAQVFSTPKNISNNAGNSLQPRIAVDSSGNINVVWMDNVVGSTSGDILFSRSADGGATFSSLKKLSTNSVQSFFPLIAVDSNGSINVIWHSFVGSLGNVDVFFSRSNDGGATFSAPTDISSNLSFSSAQQIALDSSGNINVVWASSLDIFLSRSTDGGVTFSLPKNVSNNSPVFGAFAAVPQIAVDSSSNINVIWRGLGIGPVDTFFSRSTDGGATFSTRKRISNSTGVGATGSTRIALDFSGNINVLWEEQVAPVVKILFSRSSDGGATFSVPKSLSNNLTQSSLEQMAVDSSGNINVVWQELIPGQGQSDVFFSRSKDGGATFSTKNLSNDTRSAVPQIALDSSANINVVWQDSSPGNSDIFLSRSTDGGATFSTPHNVSNNAGSSGQPQIALDSRGNINAVWEDTTPGPLFAANDIFFATATVPPPAPPTWTQKCPATTPPGRYAHGLAYDAARGQMVMFGGGDANTAFSDTWVWDGVNWALKFPATSPPATSSYAMAYDAARQQVLMFGGAVGGTIVANTWVWDGINWTQKFPISSPSPRLHAGIAYDSTRQQIVLFGGGPGSPTAFADTWVWDGTNWTQKFPGTSPPARSGHRMAYDTVRGEVVLFGGTVDAITTFFNDTWVWDGTNWTQKFPATSPTTPRFHFGLAYDAAQQGVVLFGGQGPNNTPLYSDTWAWDGTTWTQQLPATRPAGRSLPGMAYDEARSQIVLFGGFAGSFTNETWLWGQPNPTTCPIGPPPTHTLTVVSTNPNSGVPIRVSLLDNNNLSDGTTQFARTYNDGVTVTLTAPSPAGGNNFSNWSGCDSPPSNANCTVTMNGNRTVAANYVTPFPPNPPPKIASFDPTVVIQGKQSPLFSLKGTNFQTGTTVSFSGGQDITVLKLLFFSSGELLGFLNVASAAAPGPHDLIVTNPDSQAAVKTAAVTVLTTPPQPTGTRANVGNQTVYLYWNQSPVTVDGYNVYVDRIDVGAQLSIVPLGTLVSFNELIQNPSWTVFTLPDGSAPQNDTLYRFRVVAVANGALSPRSDPVFAKPSNFALAAPLHPDNTILLLHGLGGSGDTNGTWKDTISFMRNTLTWQYGGELFHLKDDLNPTGVNRAGTCEPSFVSGGDIISCHDDVSIDSSKLNEFFTAGFGNTVATYSDGRGLAHQGDEVGHFIDKINPDGNGPRLTLVAHSNGGLAARSYISGNSSAPSKITGLITYGTPHLGADLSGLREVVTDPLLWGTQTEGARQAGFVCDDPTILFPRKFVLQGYSRPMYLSPFLDDLNATDRKQPIDASGLSYVSIVGELPFPFVRGFSNDCHSQLWDILVPATSADMNNAGITLHHVRTLTSDRFHAVLPPSEGNDFSAILCALDSNCLSFDSFSPVDLDVTAPSGGKMARDFSGIAGASYMNLAEDAVHERATVLIPFPEGGQYTIKAIPKPDAQPTDTFTITLTQNGVTTTIVDHARIQDIPPDGFHPHVNSRPFANAGTDQTVECTGPNGTPVTLNGSASGDQDGDALTYKWTDSLGNVVGTSAIATAVAQMGTQIYTLTVTDPSGFSATAQTHVTVRDTTPPAVTSSVALPGGILQQNSHNMTNVGLAVTKSDICTASPTVTVQVFGNEDDQAPTDNMGTVFSPDASNIAPGTLRLRAERSDSGPGRVYLIVAKATDGAGNFSLSASTVVVPKSTSAASISTVNSLAAAARAFALNPANKSNPQPPGYFVIGDGPVVGSKP